MASFKISEKLATPEVIISGLVLIIYSVGFAGISLKYSTDLLIKLIPYVLLISLAASLAFHRENSYKTVIIFTMIAVFSWLIEAAGVATGAIFGKYSYGPALGLQILDTPLIIGLNWLLLIYGSSSILEKSGLHPLAKILSASALMVLYDLALETAAPVLGMWKFSSGIAPARNYIAWFLVAVLLHSIIKISGTMTRNTVASVVFVVQFIFFMALALIFQISE